MPTKRPPPQRQQLDQSLKNLAETIDAAFQFKPVWNRVPGERNAAEAIAGLTAAVKDLTNLLRELRPPTPPAPQEPKAPRPDGCPF